MGKFLLILFYSNEHHPMRIHQNGQLLDGIKIKNSPNNLEQNNLNNALNNNSSIYISNTHNKTIEIQKGGNKKIHLSHKMGNPMQEKDIEMK